MVTPKLHCTHHNGGVTSSNFSAHLAHMHPRTNARDRRTHARTYARTHARAHARARAYRRFGTDFSAPTRAEASWCRQPPQKMAMSQPLKKLAKAGQLQPVNSSQTQPAAMAIWTSNCDEQNIFTWQNARFAVSNCILNDDLFHDVSELLQSSHSPLPVVRGLTASSSFPPGCARGL